MDRDNRLFRKRRHNLVWQHRRRKYYRNFNNQAEMPVDLFMMRNARKFKEGLELER
jgi:hypothetical protein